MKIILIITLFLVAGWAFANGQDTITNPLCKERGHVSGGSGTITAMYCGDYLIETDSTTIRVFPACNYYTSYCMRCGHKIVEQEKETRTVIWRKEKE